ncbi:MAG: hypothetical protein WC443_05930 [Desulfobaccales bacterium]
MSINLLQTPGLKPFARNKSAEDIAVQVRPPPITEGVDGFSFLALRLLKAGCAALSRYDNRINLYLSCMAVIKPGSDPGRRLTFILYQYSFKQFS